MKKLLFIIVTLLFFATSCNWIQKRGNQVDENEINTPPMEMEDDFNTSDSITTDSTTLNF